MGLNYLTVKFDDDAYPGWRGSVDRGMGIVFIDSRINPEYAFIAMGKKTNDIKEAIALVSQYTIDRKELFNV